MSRAKLRAVRFLPRYCKQPLRERPATHLSGLYKLMRGCHIAKNPKSRLIPRQSLGRLWFCKVSLSSEPNPRLRMPRFWRVRGFAEPVLAKTSKVPAGQAPAVRVFWSTFHSSPSLRVPTCVLGKNWQPSSCPRVTQHKMLDLSFPFVKICLWQINARLTI